MIKVNSKSQLPEKIAEGDFVLIDTKGNEKETRKIVDSLKGKKVTIGVYGNEDAFNRRVVETMKINFLINPETITKEKKDTLKQRDSGLNHVVAKEMAQKKINLVFDLDSLKVLDKKQKAIVLARIIQNIKICRKAKCKMQFLSTSKDTKALESFGFSVGMSSQQVSDAIKF
jgi:RNase P/RNase MRP subunit p30